MIKKLLDTIETLTAKLNALGINDGDTADTLTKIKQIIIEISNEYTKNEDLNEDFIVDTLSKLYKGDTKKIIDSLLERWEIDGLMSKEFFEQELKEALNIAKDITIEDHFKSMEKDIETIKRNNLLEEIVKLFEDNEKKITFDDRSDEEKSNIEKKVNNWKQLFEIDSNQSILSLEDEIKNSLKATLIKVFSDFFVDNEAYINKMEEIKLQEEEEQKQKKLAESVETISKSFLTPFSFKSTFAPFVQKILAETTDVKEIKVELLKLFKPTESVENHETLKRDIMKFQLMFAEDIATYDNIDPITIVIDNIMKNKEIPNTIHYEVEIKPSEDENNSSNDGENK